MLLGGSLRPSTKLTDITEHRTDEGKLYLCAHAGQSEGPIRLWHSRSQT
jgi:hypothetical protein